MANKLVLPVKQGEELLIDFAITSDGVPLDLTGAEVVFQVKESPNVAFKPMFEKICTTTSDINTVGQIIDPLNGKVQLKLNTEDTSYPVNSYALIVFLNSGPQQDIISSDYCNSGEYRVCNQ